MSENIKRSVNIGGHATSITLEQEFWDSLKTIAEEKKKSLRALIFDIDKNKPLDGNLSSAIRLYVLKYYKSSSN